MKFLTIIVLLLPFVNTSVGFIIDEILYELGVSTFNEGLKSWLHSLKPILKTGNSSLGILPLDPFEIKYQEINVTEDNIRVAGDLTDVKIKGISDYIINDAQFKLDEMQIILNITWSKIDVKSLYRLYAEFAKSKEFPIYGDGDIRVEVDDFTVVSDAVLGVNSTKLYIKDLSSKISLKTFKFTATGIYNNEGASETINAMVSSSVPHFIKYYQWLINKDIDMKLMSLANTYLQHLTLKEVLQVFG